jgi:integrase
VHGPVLAERFGPKSLKEWRETLIGKQHSRPYINQQVGKIKRAFKWAASEELIPVTTYQALATVQGLQAGRSEAAEPKKRATVSIEDFEATLAELSPMVADMARLQLLTGCRTGSLVRATTAQFSAEDDLLLWRPRHKTEFRGTLLVLPCGPKAQAILARHLKPYTPDDFMFCPRAVRRDRRYGKRYAVSSYYRAIRRGIDRANAKRIKAAAEAGDASKAVLVQPWTPHELRHTRGHEVREKYGLEAVQSVLGHETADAAQIYSARRLELGKRVARETG